MDVNAIKTLPHTSQVYHVLKNNQKNLKKFKKVFTFYMTGYIIDARGKEIINN